MVYLDKRKNANNVIFSFGLIKKVWKTKRKKMRFYRNKKHEIIIFFYFLSNSNLKVFSLSSFSFLYTKQRLEN